jgi:hypothetical protein
MLRQGQSCHDHVDEESVGRQLGKQRSGKPVKRGLGPLQSQVHRYGFTNFRVMRSLSPIASYLARSVAPFVYVGGSAHTPPS